MSSVVSFSRKGVVHFLSLLLIGALVIVGGCDQGPTSQVADTPEDDGPEQVSSALQEAITVKDRRSDEFLDRPGIVGVGAGVDTEGKANVVVYATNAKMAQKANLPSHANGVPLRVEVTGLIVAGTTSRERPAPVGFSIGHPDITAGTYGARVQDGSGNVYALSNNHVLANSNDANIGDSALQPGPADGGSDPDDKVGELYDYEPIDFDGTNTMDAAIASSSTSNLDAETPSSAYGAPGTNPTSATVGLNVQKFGRTTEHTQGEVSEVDVTVDVCYETSGPFNCTASARFENQIAITPGDFSDGGDSGSLIVTDDSNKDPVGLLFAGSDTRTLANPISDVLNRFNVTIDDGSGDDGGDTNSPPTASFTYSCTDLSCDFDGSGSSDSDGSITSYDWDFGDGATGTGETVSHTYGSEGTYTVTLTVTDDSNATDSESQDVTVSTSTTLSVDDITPSSVSAGSSVDVTITGSGFESGADVSLENGSGPTPSTSNVTVVDATEISATISTRSGGPPRDRVWDVRVTNPDGTSAVLIDGFTVTP